MAFQEPGMQSLVGGLPRMKSSSDIKIYISFKVVLCSSFPPVCLSIPQVFSH